MDTDFGPDVIEGAAQRAAKEDRMNWASAGPEGRHLYRRIALAVLDYMASEGVVILSVEELHELKSDAAALRLYRRGPVRAVVGMPLPPLLRLAK